MSDFNSSQNVDRRDFIGMGVAVAAGAGALSMRATAAEGNEHADAADGSNKSIPTRAFGNTGHTLPILGMGGSAMVAQWIEAYGAKLLSLEERAAMVRYAFDCGVRYFDTARVYYESESIVGKGLKGVRKDAFIATKVAVADPSEVRSSLETSLKELQTDHVELVQIHSPAIEKIGFAKSMKLYEELLKLRDEKMLRFIGLTTHVAFEDVYKMISTGGFDQVLLAYGYFNKGMDTLLSNRNLEFRNLCMAKAHELGMAIVAMKVLGASIFSHNAKKRLPDYDPESLARLPGAAIRWVLQDYRVSLLTGLM